ncbi:unnamed protein product [Linum tenue]|uniref:Uncharacterized protein n=1 Tax=Linum tenue TaxID=586396 RepID=A0AAV0PLK9_9ROSI|nr:unnamed protein product [Linum tenue]
MSEPSENFGLEDNRLGLFDVSLEDDCLYATSSPPRQDFHFSDDLLDNASDLSLNLVDSQSLQSTECGDDAREHQPLESLEPEQTKKNMKYNLRKSLAWDSAFFTSAGVLEPDELSSMMGKTEEREMLPGIREELERSTDSLSTLASEGLTMENLEGDLFGDIRASIQKSSGSSCVASSKPNSGTRTGSVKAATPAKQSPKKLEEASETKLKPKVSSKKTDVVIPGSRRTMKNTSTVTQAQQAPMQSLETKRETTSLSKPPKIAARVGISTAAKKGPLSNTCAKSEKDKGKCSASNSANTKDLTGRVKIPISGGSRNTVSKLSPPWRSSSSSTKTESVVSSFDCSESVSSDGGSSRSSLSSFTRKVDPRAGGGVPSSSLIAKATSRIGSKSKNHSTIPHRSPYLRSVVKHSPNISPASSVSEWSSESISLSPTSTLNKRSNCSRSSIDTASCVDPYEDDESSQVSDSPSHCSEPGAAGTQGGQSLRRVSKENGELLTESAKPSGLRLPSPKIGFFDGARSSSRNSNGSSQTKPGVVPSGLPRPGGVLHGNLGKPGNLQTAKSATTPARTPRIGTQQQSLSSSKSKSQVSNNQAPSMAVPKVGSSGLLRSAKRSPSISPRVQSKTSSPGSSAEKNPKPVKVTPIDEQHTPFVLPSTKSIEKVGLEEKVSSFECEHKESHIMVGDVVAMSRENSPSQKEMNCFEQ